METEPDAHKIDAIFELREAVEAKVHAECDLEASQTEAAREALAAAQRDVEEATQEALQTCHECGEPHAKDAPHAKNTAHASPVNDRPSADRVSDRYDNVVAVNFRPKAEPA